MKPMERIIMAWAFLGAWIGLWLTGPEDPNDTYHASAYVLFIAVIALAVFLLVRAYIIFYREQNADRIRKVLRNRDTRPRR